MNNYRHFVYRTDVNWRYIQGLGWKDHSTSISVSYPMDDYLDGQIFPVCVQGKNLQLKVSGSPDKNCVIAPIRIRVRADDHGPGKPPPFSPGFNPSVVPMHTSLGGTRQLELGGVVGDQALCSVRSSVLMCVSNMHNMAKSIFRRQTTTNSRFAVTQITRY